MRPYNELIMAVVFVHSSIFRRLLEPNSVQNGCNSNAIESAKQCNCP